METESGLYFGKGTEKFHYVFTFRFRNYFSGANVPPEIISLDALIEMEIFAKINFIKQDKLLSMIPQIKISSYFTFWRPVIENVFKHNYTKFEIIKFKKVKRSLLPGALLN